MPVWSKSARNNTSHQPNNYGYLPRLATPPNNCHSRLAVEILFRFLKNLWKKNYFKSKKHRRERREGETMPDDLHFEERIDRLMQHTDSHSHMWVVLTIVLTTRVLLQQERLVDAGGAAVRVLRQIQYHIAESLRRPTALVLLTRMRKRRLINWLSNCDVRIKSTKKPNAVDLHS